MKKLFYSLLIVATFSLISCGSDNNTSNNEDANKGVEKSEKRGGTLNLVENEAYQTLNPHKVIDANSFHVSSQIFESLLKFNNKSLALEPSIANSWEVDETETKYTFKLKKGVFFHDADCFDNGKGKELTAKDVEFTFLHLAKNIEHSTQNTFLKNIEGIDDYRSGVTQNISGITVVDNHTLLISLVKTMSSFPYFLAHLNTAIVAPEAIEKYGDEAKIGTGPFKYVPELDTEKSIALVRNENYHLKDSANIQLPYLDTVIFSYVSNNNEQLTLFNEGKIDYLLGLPAESIKEVVENQISDFQNKPPKYILDRFPNMATVYLELVTTNEPLNNIKIRQAIAHAINKQKIVDKILKGEGIYGNHGIVPPAIKKYNSDQTKGLVYDVDLAKKLFAEAGYTNGDDFPTLTLKTNGEGTINTKVAFELQKQLKSSLNINIEIEIVSLQTKIEDSKIGKGDIFVSGWLADYPLPSNFLSLVDGSLVPEDNTQPSYPNSSRYNNKIFNELYMEAITTLDENERNAKLLEIEQIAIDEAPVIPLWYAEKYVLQQSNVVNLKSNPMYILDLTKVYKK